jgi:hypothetical protein
MKGASERIGLPRWRQAWTMAALLTTMIVSPPTSVQIARCSGSAAGAAAALEQRHAAVAEAQREHRVGGAEDQQQRGVERLPGRSGGEGPGAGGDLVVAEQQPQHRHQREPAIGRFAPPQQPQRREEGRHRRADREAQHLQVAPHHALAFVGGLQHGRRPDHDGPQPGLVDREPGDAHQQGVGARAQQRRRQQPVARRVPGPRERLDQAGVARDRRAVEVHGAGHVEVVQQQAGLARFGRLFPAQPVPGHAVEAAPAVGPVVGQGGDRLPAVLGRTRVVPAGGAHGLDAQRGEVLGQRAMRAQQQRQRRGQAVQQAQRSSPCSRAW